MKAALLIDFGSTYTKVTAVDLEAQELLGTGSSYTTVETDINDGLENALAQLEETIGKLDYEVRLGCSSAAGGLKMVSSGMVPNLTSEAARLASLGAGAKIAKVYSYELTEEDVDEIAELSPDIFLLTGGTDGGDTECIIRNAQTLSKCSKHFPVVIAGNRSAGAKCAEILEGWEIYRCENVMPNLGETNVEPVQDVIRDLFLRRIIKAKGLSQASDLIENIIMPTPSAIMRAMKLLSKGTDNMRGLGELIALDLGGATTDVYSMATGLPKTDNTILKGLEEPFAKRTVEGDIGMRYSAAGVAQAVGMPRLSRVAGQDEDKVEEWLGAIASKPGVLPETPQQQSIDDAIASCALETAMTRHAGTMEQVYTPMGMAYSQEGKDLTEVSSVVLTGGAIIRNPRALEIAQELTYKPGIPISLKPKEAKVFVDKKYILAAMGLLSENYPDIALNIIYKELEEYGTAKSAT